MVGDARQAQLVLEGAGLGAEPAEDGKVGVAAPGGGLFLDGIDDKPGLVRVGVGLVADDGRPLAGSGKETLFQLAAVVGDQLVGGAQNGAGGAVVLLQLDHPGAGEVLIVLQDAAQVGAAPAVQALVVVAHGHDVAPLAGQELDHLQLRHVGVLELVHLDVAEAALVVLPHRRHALEQVDEEADQVVEVDQVVLAQLLLVALPGLRRQPVDVAVGLRDELRHPLPVDQGVGGPPVEQGVGVGQFVLVAADAPEDRLGLVSLQVEVALGDGLLDQGQLGVGVGDGKVPVPPRLGVLGQALPQQRQGGGVEGADHHAAGRRADQGHGPLPHLPGRLVGEGDAEHFLGPGAGGQEAGQAVDGGLRLAGAGAGDDQQRAVAVHGGLALRRIQAPGQGIEARQQGHRRFLLARVPPEPWIILLIIQRQVDPGLSVTGKFTGTARRRRPESEVLRKENHCLLTKVVQ